MTSFDRTLHHIGFPTLHDVPSVHSTLNTDPAFVRVRSDVASFLEYAAGLALDAAPYLRQLVQLTGYAGSSRHKFKPVQCDTSAKYAASLARLVLFLVTRNQAQCLQLFPDTACHTRIEASITAYSEAHNKQHDSSQINNAIACLLGSVLLQQVSPVESTLSLAIQPLLALFSVKQVRDSRRFKSGAEMAPFLAALIYCTSCVALYSIRSGATHTLGDLHTVSQCLDMERNTAYAYLRDVMDKTCGDKRFDTSPIRFSSCTVPNHNAKAILDSSCGVVDDIHLSLGTVRDYLVRVETEMHTLLAHELLLAHPRELKNRTAILHHTALVDSAAHSLQDRHKQTGADH